MKMVLKRYKLKDENEKALSSSFDTNFNMTMDAANVNRTSLHVPYNFMGLNSAASQPNVEVRAST